MHKISFVVKQSCLRLKINKNCPLESKSKDHSNKFQTQFNECGLKARRTSESKFILSKICVLEMLSIIVSYNNIS